jgi:hypothetical protein
MKAGGLRTFEEDGSERVGEKIYGLFFHSFYISLVPQRSKCIYKRKLNVKNLH